MKSMTGFGRSSNRTDGKTPALAKAKPIAKTKASRDSGGRKVASDADARQIQLEVSIKSVNGRFLEVRMHLPREYAGMESDVRAIVTRHFSRGTVDVYVNRIKSASSLEVTVNVPLAKKWLDAYRELASGLKLKSAPSLELLTQIPDVMKVEEAPVVAESERGVVMDLVGRAAEACDAERAREGAALQRELTSLCDRLHTLADRMREMVLEANAELDKRFRDRLAKLGLEGKLDEQRIAQEVVLQIDRADISEELQRLGEHLTAYRQLLQSPEAQGKKLDFYAQELLREVNTIGSKSHIARLTSLVVDAKTLVEKIREQVQNVE